MLDIFKNDAFSVINLTDAINEVKFVPGYISSTGLFTATPVDTTVVGIEKKSDNSLLLVPRTPRGGPGTTTGKTRRDLRPFYVPHQEINDAVMAEEVQGVRAFGQERAVETLQGKLAGRFAEHQRSFSATEEYARIGAVKGIVVYNDDGEDLNLFDEFGVSQIAELPFNFTVKVEGALRAYCASVIRTLGTELGGLPFSGVEALCSDTFFDALIKNAEVRQSYLAQQEASDLRKGYIAPGGQTWGSFSFGGIQWTNYRGAVGDTAFIEADKCHIYPTGVPGLFRTYYAPADLIETVNTPGKRLYVNQYTMQNNKGVHLDVQSNALHICTRPRVLLKGKLGA
jgi:hypothetical protein